MSISIQKQVSLKELTTLKVGGDTEFFVAVHTEDELKEAVAYAKAEGLVIHILGGGSNTLVPDEGVSGLTIQIALKGLSVQKNDTQVLLTAAAGEVLDEVIAQSVENGWWGLENLTAIPGSIGATPVQNVGAYGVETKDVLLEVRAFDIQTNEFVTLSNGACAFEYRDSLFKKAEGKRYIITSVTYVLSEKPVRNISYRDLAQHFAEGSEPSQQEIREVLMKVRGGKFPDWHVVGTAGSFFKNPVVTQEVFSKLRARYEQLPGFETQNGDVKIPLGFILDKVLNLKGYKKGNVSSYKDQALVLVAERGATANEITNFAREITARVKEITDIDVEWEVTVM